jgi:hypothetical protein
MTGQGWQERLGRRKQAVGTFGPKLKGQVTD